MITPKPQTGIPYRLVRSRRRSVAIVVHHGDVEVRAPNRVPLYWINAFVQEKADWIERRLAEEAERHTERYRLMHGHALPFLGNPREVQIETASRNRITIDDNRLLMQLRETTPAYTLKAFQKWLGEQARAYLVPRSEQFAHQLGVSHKLAAVNFRYTRSKWGHCTHRGVLQFNPLIMLAPATVADYLMAHEVSHLLHPNHSKAYWQTVASICPDHHVQRRWLRANEYRFQLRLED